MAKKTVTASMPSRKQEDDWRAESDMHTLMEAEKIKADPKRHARACAMAKERMMAMASVATEGDADKG